MKYTQIPANTFKQIQLNAGILATSFNVATGEVGALVGATSGGLNFTATPSFKDFGEDIDNCPKNTKELKKVDDIEVKISGTFVTVTPALAKMLAGASDIDSDDATHIIPRRDLESSDFSDLWWIGDYSDVNSGVTAGFLAIHVMNALSTGGFQIQSTDKDKGKFSFEFTGHYSFSNPDLVPYELYVKGDSESAPYILLGDHSITLDIDEEYQLSAEVSPAGQTITWAVASGTVASVTAGKVKGLTEGNTIVTASITVDGVTYNDTCTVIVEGE